MDFPVLQLLPKRDRAVLNRHPWIFSGALHNIVNSQDGEIVEVKNSEGDVLGYGFYSKESQISCRMFDWDKKPGDFNAVSYWQTKIEAALNIRKKLLIDANTNVYRLLHAEGDFLPGIIADVYGDHLVLQIGITGIEKIKPLLLDAFHNLGFRQISIKKKDPTPNNKQQNQDFTGDQISENLVNILEHGMSFTVDIKGGQKTGFFIDQRENRQLLRKHAQGKVVLNAFSYTGGFSIYALAGGAKEVYSLDISQDAIDGADHNAKINHLGANHQLLCMDCFDYLKQMPQDFFDIIVLDPPAFAKHSRAVDNAAKGYKQINMKAIQKIKPGGLIFTFSCSQHISKDLFQKIVFGAASDVKRNVRIVQQLHQPADHPINIYHPEGEYLKGLLLWVE